MPREKGYVIRTDGKKVTLGLTGGDHCSACAAKSVCISKEESRELILENKFRLVEGDQVEIEYTEKQKISIALIIFLAPVVFLIIGYIIGTLGFQSNSYGFAGAVLGLILGLLFPLFIHKMNEKKGFLMPVIIRKIERSKI